MTEDEIRQSADYFSSLKWTPWIEVVESDDGAEDASLGRHVAAARGRRRRHGAARPPDHRDAEKHGIHREAQEPALGVHGIRAERLDREGRGACDEPSTKTTQCTICHGADLGGLAVVPTLPRSLAELHSAAARRLEARHSARALVAADGARGRDLTADDILNLSAYLSSLPAR